MLSRRGKERPVVAARAPAWLQTRGRRSGAVGARGVDRHDGLGDFAPRCVHPRQQLHPLPALDPVTEPMLNRETEVWNRSKGRLHLVAPKARDDHDVVGRALLSHVVERSVGGRQRAPPVQEDHALRRLPVREEHLLRIERLEVDAHPHHPERGEAEADGHPVLLRLAHHRLEVDQEAPRPVLSRVGRNVLQILLSAALNLDRVHLQRLVERRLKLALVPWVDLQRAVEHAREARKLGHDRHARGNVGQRARHNVLERVGVDSLTHGGIYDDGAA
eukprot:6191781-Pleurochrysis_carterae.AAC.1